MRGPRPLARAFDAVPDMPLRYDEGALIEELEALKLLVVEVRDFVAMLVPAELADAQPEKPPKAKQVTLGGKVSVRISNPAR